MLSGTYADYVYLAVCLEDSGVYLARDSLDSSGRELFHADSMREEFMLRWEGNPYFKEHSIHKLGGDFCCSDESISFHYVRGRDQLFMDILFSNFSTQSRQ